MPVYKFFTWLFSGNKLNYLTFIKFRLFIISFRIFYRDCFACINLIYCKSWSVLSIDIDDISIIFSLIVFIFNITQIFYLSIKSFFYLNFFIFKRRNNIITKSFFINDYILFFSFFTVFAYYIYWI